MSINTLPSTARPLWQLSGFNTRESWLVCYPAIWGLSFAIKHYDLTPDRSTLATLIAANWLCMTLTHGAFCTLNDICDADIDKFSTRTAKRPLPFGRCSPRLAKMWFCLQLLVAITTMYTLLGVASWLAMLPCQALAAVYPLAKRHVPWPQFVLAPTVGWPVFAGWLSAQTKCGVVERVGVGICGMLFVLHAVWNIYYGTCYGLQDIVGDRKSGVGSLAQFLGVKYFEPFLCGTMMVCLGLFMWVAEQAGSSLFLKGMGIGVWALTVPFQFWALDFDDPSSGGRIMKFNVDLGMYITAMVLADFLVMN